MVSSWQNGRMETILHSLHRILTGTDDYLSHRSALFFHGFLPDLPEPVTIVTTGRRRGRRLPTRAIQFITHPARRPRDAQDLNVDEVCLRVASLEQALVDLVCDLHLGWRIEDLGPLFARLPYSVPRLVDLAVATSDVARKRVLFWILWAGRAGWEDLPTDLSRTPVKLDPALDGLPAE
jgi:hypothetical protein